MAYDLEAVAREIDRRLSDGHFNLKDICEEIGIHRHSADRALRKTFGCCFRERRAFWQAARFDRITRNHIVTGKELAGELGYANYFCLKRRLRQLGLKPYHLTKREPYT
jgi:AraC-like DNA-binding protein